MPRPKKTNEVALYLVQKPDKTLDWYTPTQAPAFWPVIAVGFEDGSIRWRENP